MTEAKEIIAKFLVMQVEHPLTGQIHRFWFENATVGRPVKEDAGSAIEQRLLPRECREAVSRQAPPQAACTACRQAAYHDLPGWTGCIHWQAVWQA